MNFYLQNKRFKWLFAIVPLNNQIDIALKYFANVGAVFVPEAICEKKSMSMVERTLVIRVLPF